MSSKRWVYIAWHIALRWVKSVRTWLLVTATVIQVGVFFVPMWKYAPREKFGTSILVYLVLHALKVWQQSRPKDRRIVERNYMARKHAQYKLVHDLQRHTSMSPDEVKEFQREALGLIAEYVRDHHLDSARPTIFANLLAPDGQGHLRVIARDREHRQPESRLAINKPSVVAHAYRDGTVHATGDVYANFPDTPPGKPYRSILAMPVHHKGCVVGVISVDSSSKFHFDLGRDKLSDCLRPYVACLAWTFSEGRKVLSNGSAKKRRRR